VKRWREEGERERDEQSAEQARCARASAGARVHGAAREPASDHVTAEAARSQVRCADRNQLAIR
jgi:hypothetical protein